MIEWFAGLVDGEGCFTFHITRAGDKHVSVNPVFILTMSDGEWTNVVTNLLEQYGIGYRSRMHNYLREIRVPEEKM